MGTGSAPYSEGFPLALFLIHPLLFFFFYVAATILTSLSWQFIPPPLLQTLGTWLLGCVGTLVFKLPSRIGRDSKRLSPCRCTFSQCFSERSSVDFLASFFLPFFSVHPFFFIIF